MKRYPEFVGSFFGTGLMGLTYLLISGIPKHFSGDDFILLKASQSRGGYASSLTSCITDIGMGKWRPAFVCAVSPALDIFGDRYWCFFLLNLALVFLICLVAGNVLKRIVQLPEWLVVLCVLVVPFSRFAWYGRISPFGLMEFGALLFALLFIRQFMAALDQQTISSWYLAGTFASLSALFHERYLVLLAAGFLVAIFNVRNKRTPVSFAPWLVFSGFLFVVKVLFLRTDPLVGGGEAPLKASFDTWVLEHFFVGLKAVFGIGNGTNISFDTTGYARLPALGVLGEVWLVVLTMMLLLCALKTALQRGVLTFNNDSSKDSIERQTVLGQLLLMSGLLLIIPAATVISRIEGRWLFGPEVFLFLFMIVAIRAQKSRVVFVSILLLFSVTCLKFLPDYEEPITLSNEVLEYVDGKLDGRNQLVYTIVDPRSRPELINWLDWVLGRAEKFEQIGVKSARYVDNRQCTGSCVKLVFEDTERFSFVGS